MRLSSSLLLRLLGLLVSVSCAQAATSAELPAATLSAQACEGIASGFQYPNTDIVSARMQANGEAKQGKLGLPAHCVVAGAMFRRVGKDGHDYRIGFEMRLPERWNGRFYYQANGGLDGAVLPAYGALGGGPVTGALMQGFAVISSDAGHTSEQNATFGLEPQARLDYGYQAVKKLTPMAKQLIVQAYGHAPDKSYIGGCSNGGRHAMVAASRLADQYDGFLIGAPGYRLPYAALSQVWSAQQFSKLATPGAMTKHPMNPAASIPDLSTALTAQERSLIRTAILKKCDALDGVSDGIVSDYRGCQKVFHLSTDVKTCSGARDGTCLTEGQKTMLSAVLNGPQTKRGEPIYQAFPLDPGISGDNWALWKQTFSLVLDPLAAGIVFSTPPSKVDPLTDDIASRYEALSATNDVFTESAIAFMLPPGEENPLYTRQILTKHAKMMLFHGTSDPVFSVDDTRAWMDRVAQVHGGDASEFARFFPVPGMNHCSGGPATDQFDMLTPLVQWVEQGVKPDFVVATARGPGNPGGANPEVPADWSASRSRLLCAYPKTAHFKGSGSPEDSQNFVCQ